MIPAVEALTLPTAQLDDREKRMIADLVFKIDMHVRRNMRYAGAVMNFPGMPTELATPITHILEEAGWQCQWTPMMSELAGDRAVGLMLHLCPSREAYKAAAVSMEITN